MLEETINFLNIDPEGIYVDATLGGGGLSEQILHNLNEKGKLISIDIDKEAIEYCQEKFKYENRIKIYNSNFIFIDEILKKEKIEKVNGICMDLGVSSYQIDNPERGFSYIHNGKLDMRMGQSGTSAYDIVNFYEESRLSEVILKYGEEKFHKNIAKMICRQRKIKKIESTKELVEVIEKVVPRFNLGHSAKRTFQAIRIEVNDELKNLEITLDKCIKLLKTGGRILVLSFHSLEDKIVKQKMKFWEKECVCPKSFPVCVCSKIQQAKIINKKIIVSSDEEIKKNSRSKSAKLRICEKI